METYDVVVVGGGAAGLAGAKALLRSRRTVLLLDTGRPRNAPAEGAHNLLGLEGIAPLELLARGRAEVTSYGGEVRAAEATAARVADGPGGLLVVSLADGTEVGARRLLVASGLTDDLPDLPGVREHWGRTVLHCPFCHGWEVRDRRIGVLATSPAATHQALLFSRLSDRVVLVTHQAEPTAHDRDRLALAGVEVLEAVASSYDAASGLALADGTVLPVEALVVAPQMRARSAVLDSLGLAAQPHPSGMGEDYPCDERGRTPVAGVWVAGNVGDLGAQVAGAAAAGLLAGAAIHGDLVEADLADAARAGAETRQVRAMVKR